MASPFARAVPGGVEIALLVRPRASRTRVVGPQGDRLKVQVAAPPVEGAANRAVRALLADRLGVAPSAVELCAGETSARKTVRVAGVDLAVVVRLAREAG